MACTEGVEEGDAVIDDRIDVGNVGDEAVGEAMALVIDGAGGETGFGEMDGSELDNPAGLAGETMDDGESTDDVSRGKRSPGLREELHSPGVGDVVGGVRDGMASVEVGGGEGAEEALLGGVSHGMHHCWLKCARSPPLSRLKTQDSRSELEGGCRFNDF